MGLTEYNMYNWQNHQSKRGDRAVRNGRKKKKKMYKKQNKFWYVKSTPRDIKVYLGSSFRTFIWMFITLEIVLICSTVLAVNVDWQIKSPVTFGTIAYLNCKISDQDDLNCTRRFRQWLGGEQYGSLCHDTKCNESLKKYYVMQVDNMCVYTLMIERFSEHDVNCDYTCSYGIWRKRKSLTLDDMEYRYTPDGNEVSKEFEVTKNNTIKLIIRISKIYPMPICSAVLNSKNITDAMHMTRDKVGIYFAVGLDINHRTKSCSGKLNVTCYLRNVQINIANVKFDKCKEEDSSSNNGAVIGISIGAVLFVLSVVCLICNHRTKAKSCDYTLTLEEEKMVCYNDELVNIEDKGIMTDTSIQSNAYPVLRTDRIALRKKEPVIGKIGSIVLYESNLECLDDGRWLNDQVINAYLAIIQRDHRDLVLCLDTFFLIEKKIDLKSIKSINTVDTVLIPVPFNNHWSLLVVQSKNQTVFVLDSSGGTNKKAVEFIRSLYKKEFSIDLSYTKKLKHKISLQENGYDCGVFVLLYSEALTGGQSLCFTKNEIATARQRIRQKIMKAVIKSI